MHFSHGIARFVKIKNKENPFDLFLFSLRLEIYVLLPRTDTVRFELQQNHVLSIHFIIIIIFFFILFPRTILHLYYNNPFTYNSCKILSSSFFFYFKLFELIPFYNCWQVQPTIFLCKVTTRLLSTW